MTPTRQTVRIALGVLSGALLLGCADVAPLSVDGTTHLQNRAANRCVNVQADIDVALGPWIFGGEVVLGAPPMPIVLGGIDGWMASVLLEEQPRGHGGTMHLILTHVFVTEEPAQVGELLAIDLNEVDDYFLTDDRAVCALGGDPSSCRLNNRMEIVAGAGIFANASGFLQNHGEILFSPWPDRLISRMHGRVCGDGVGA